MLSYYITPHYLSFSIAITCKAINTKPHMVMSPPRCNVDDGTKKGEKCFVSCQPGFELKPQSARSYICHKNGHFEIVEDLFEPQCVRKYYNKLQS